MEFIDQAIVAYRKGDTEYATRIAEVALQAARKAQDAKREVEAICMLARIALRIGDLDQVASFVAEARSKARGDPSSERLILHVEAVAARMRGSLAAARDLCTAGLKLSESLDDDQATIAEYRNLAYVELHAGNRERARKLFLEARRRAELLGHQELLPYIVADAAVLAMEDGDGGKAATLAGAADAALKAAGEAPDPEEVVEQGLLRARLQEALGKRALQFSFEVGVKLTIAEALKRM